MEPCTLPSFAYSRQSICAVLLAAALCHFCPHRPHAEPPTQPSSTFAGFDLPDNWEARFWNSSNAKALFKLDPRAVADLVPTQGGVKHCRCPSCGASEADDSLSWTVANPKTLICGQCGVVVPNESIPKPNDKKAVPEETVEVKPGLVHHYPYHEPDPEQQRFPGERLFLSAKADEEARAFLAKAALYAAIRYHEQPVGRKDLALARVASVIILRFAQVYPNYATRYDQPLAPKYFGSANLPPPYRAHYQTGKWEWAATQNVPLNLVVAYALLRDDPAMSAAGKMLGETDPRRTIERDLFLASAEFVRLQPEEFTEESLQADRGMLAVGRLVNDSALTAQAIARLQRLSERGFYYDGFWRQGTVTAHQRVLDRLDGWFDRLLAGAPGFQGFGALPVLNLARSANAAVLRDTAVPDVQLASWPAPTNRPAPRAPRLLGGAGIARLAVGQGADALDLELRSLASLNPNQIQRQALRLSVGGSLALGDLDELPGLASGFDRASASRNTVLVDGVNQRETLPKANEPASGGNFVFFAADPDFQVVTLDDTKSYPKLTTRYRQTLIASAGKRFRYAVSVFEVNGGRQHDQFFHGPASSKVRWRLSVPTQAAPITLLPTGLTYVPNLSLDDGRWFIQAYGDFTPLTQTTLSKPAFAWFDPPQPARGGLRLHILGSLPLTATTAASPNPISSSEEETIDSGRGSLMLRRHAANEAFFQTTFVTLFEPITRSIEPLARIGRVASPPQTIVLYVETTEGPEHLVFNLAPGKSIQVTLADGRTLATDGRVVRVAATGITLTGGTFATCEQLGVKQTEAKGRIVHAERSDSSGKLGWFDTDDVLTVPDGLAGRVLLVRHGDGTTHGWTLDRVVPLSTGTRMYVKEQTGFQIEASSGAAVFSQYPQTRHPGPHEFRVSRIARSFR